MTLADGTRLGRYEIRSKIGEGGMGEVYLAGPPKQLTNFKTDQIFWFDFSRDGKQLVLSRGSETSDVILIRDFR